MENLGRVVLLMGGVSSEREVSLMSGEGVHKALVSKGVDVLKFDPKTDSLETLEKGGFDRAFIALHGRLGEDGTIQGVLNYLGIPYTGPGVTASAMAIDKDLTKRVWRSAGIPVPEGVMIDPKADDAVLEEAIACLGATGLVVKPAHDGSSIGVTKLAEPTVAALRKALEDAAGVRGDEVLVEEYIHGREFTVAVLDGRALPVIEIRAPEGDYDFNNKYFGDAVHYDCPAKLEDEAAATLGSLCERAFAAVGARGWSRIDALQRADGSHIRFDDNAAVHHQHARTHARDNAEVVGDHDDGGAKLLLQALQQVENLRLNGHVQRGGRFVGDNQPRVAHDGHGDHDALAHAAGKLVRILLHAALRVRNFNQTQLFKHDFARFRFGNAFVDAQRLDQLIADGEKRVERGHRVLKDHADLIAADFAEHFGRECGQIRAVKDHFIRRDFGVVGQKVQHGEHRDALAAAAFADDADGFAFIHV